MDFIRVFPRKTNASPDDDYVRFGAPGLFDHADKVHISVTWTWDKAKGEQLAENWRGVCSNVSIGGPAYGDPGGEFEPGLYLKRGYVFTSRGCPNRCWFCFVPVREGSIRELEVKDGWNLLDSNLLACSRGHVEKVFEMLKRQKEYIRFTGGLEAARLEDWHIDQLLDLRIDTLWMAYDTADDYEPLRSAVNRFRHAGLRNIRRNVRCYVLIGWGKDTMEKAEERLKRVVGLGIMPMAMLYNHGEERIKDKEEWVHFAKTWASPWVVGTKMKEVLYEPS